MRKIFDKHSFFVHPLTIWLLSSALLIAVFLFWAVRPENADRAHAGVLYASRINNRTPVALNGEWEYYDRQFLFPSDFSGNTDDVSQKSFRTLPGSRPFAHGYGTYRLTFSFLSSESLYSLRLTGIQSAARIYIDGTLISDIGFTSSLESSSETSKDSQYIVFPLNIMRRTHEMIIHVSSFSNYPSGITNPIYFGTQIDGYRLSSQFKFAESVGLISVGILIIFLIFILFFRIQIRSTLHLLLCTIMLAFQLIYSSNELLTQPIQSHIYLFLARINISSLCLMGLGMVLLAGQNCYSQRILHKTLKIYYYMLPVLLCFTIVCPGKHLLYAKILANLYLTISFLHACSLLVTEACGRSYSALMLLLSLTFCSYYFSLQFFYSKGIVAANAYNSIYIFLLVAYAASQLAYVSLQVSRIYTGNARLAQRMAVSDKLKSEFISAASHELRTPLHGILNIIESAVSRLEQPDRAKEQLHMALNLARKMNSVIDDLYGFYSSSEQLNTSLKPINLDIEVNAAIEVFYYTSGNSKLALINALSPDALWVNADESCLWEILNNIIGNAVKYTEAGSITVTSRQADGKIYVSVTDTGIGIPAADIDYIFDKSVRLENASQKAEGLGYGLYLVRQLVKRMNGEIYVEWSVPGKGTCITFYLGACDLRMINQENTAKQILGHTEQNYLETFRGTSASLLVVDDNEDNLHIIRTLFEDCCFSMDLVQNAGKALDLLDKHSYDIIILDVMMPEMSGFELCRTIRKRYSHFELPVLLLTACDSTEEILTGFWSGANDYVVKPADRTELRTRVFSLVTLKQSVNAALENEMLFLQAQIRPHFLYNAFNTISAVALTDGPKASDLIDDLAIYLRGCFNSDVSQGLIPIETELGIVDSYVRIEQARFGKRLRFESAVETSKSFFLPPLTIQPLVENSIRHATLDSYADIEIRLSVTEDTQFIYITIRDNGKGIEPSTISELMDDCPSRRTGGIGLNNVNRRLKLHYGIPLKVHTTPKDGTRILIKIPRTHISGKK